MQYSPYRVVYDVQRILLLYTVYCMLYVEEMFASFCPLYLCLSLMSLRLFELLNLLE